MPAINNLAFWTVSDHDHFLILNGEIIAASNDHEHGPKAATIVRSAAYALSKTLGVYWTANEGEWAHDEQDPDEFFAAQYPEHQGDRTFDQVVEDAEHEFWDVIGKGFPRCKSGDLDPGSTIEFSEACRKVVDRWLDYNDPARREGDE